MPRQFLIDRPERLTPFTAWLGKQALPLDVRVEPYVPKRSNPQNARLWKLHSLAAEVTGYSAEDMHEHCLIKFFGQAEQTVGEVTRIVPLKRSSQRNKKEFAEFMEAVEVFYGQEFGVWLQSDTLEES